MGTIVSRIEMIGDFRNNVIAIIKTASNKAIPLFPDFNSDFSSISPVIRLKNHMLPKITMKAKIVTNKKNKRTYPIEARIQLPDVSLDK